MEYAGMWELGLSHDVWRPFLEHHQAVPYCTGQLIYLQDTEADCFYYLQHGKVKTFISDPEGNEKVLTIYRSGNLFGEASFFDQMPRVSSAVALSSCQIISINREMVIREIGRDPQLALALLKYLARTVRLLSAHVDNMAFLRADQRVARYILSIIPEADGKTGCTHEEIAGAVSVNRVTVSRILNQFVKNGWIETGYRFLRIVNRQALMNLELE